MERGNVTLMSWMDCCRGKASSALIGLSEMDTLVGKDYQYVEMVFPFVTAFLALAPGFLQERPKTFVHTTDSELLHEVSTY